MTRFTVPDTVHATPGDNGRLVLLNRATGRWHMLNRTGADFYAVLRATTDIGTAIDTLVEHHPGVPAERIRRDAEDLVAALVSRGLLILADDRRAAGVLVALPGPGPAIPGRHRFAAVVAFVLTLVLLRLPFRISTTVVARMKRRLGRREATVPEARDALAAARWIGRLHPGRVACLEQSLAAVLTAALLGLRVDWCLGFAVDPQAFHAWIEVAGESVVAASDDPIRPTYRRVFSV